MTKPYIDYSEAISKGVYNWLDANKETVQQIIKDAIHKSTAEAVDLVAGATMVSVGKFLDANTSDLISGISAAVAASWVARERMLPPHTYDRKGQ